MAAQLRGGKRRLQRQRHQQGGKGQDWPAGNGARIWHSPAMLSRECAAVKAASGNAPPRIGWSARTGSVAVEALGQEIVEIGLETRPGIDTEIVQERPGVDAGRMHIVETEPDRIIADGIDREDGDVALAAD